MNRRIIIFSNSSWNLYNFRKSLITTLKDSNFEVYCVCKKDEYSEQLEGICDRLIILNLDATSTRIFKDIFCVIQFCLILLRFRPKAVLSFTLKMNIYSGLLCRLLLIPHYPTISGLGSAYLKSNKLRQSIIFVQRVSFRKSKSIFFHNDTDLRTFRYLKIGHQKYYQSVAGSGVDIDAFKGVPSDLRFLNDGLHLYFIGRLIKDKGIVEYLEAAKILSTTHPFIKFHIVGRFDDGNPSAIREDLLNMYLEHNVFYHGSTDNVLKYLTRADFVVLPSYREGLSKLLLEAAASATPMIAANVPGCREVVIDNVTGFLCKPRSVEDLARAIRLASQADRDKKIKLGERARSLAISQFSSRAVADTYAANIELLYS